jgi:hypothetical protein
MLDIPALLGLPVLLVVGIRLGCLNHALLSALAIAARGLRLAGWVANRIEPACPWLTAYATQRARLPAPLVAERGVSAWKRRATRCRCTAGAGLRGGHGAWRSFLRARHLARPFAPALIRAKIPRFLQHPK